MWIGLLLTFGLSLAGESPSSQLTAFIQSGGKNRSPGTTGAAQSLNWLREQVKKISGWEVDEHLFQPDTDFAVQNLKDDFKRLVVGKFPTQHPEYLKWKTFTTDAILFQEALRGRMGTNLILRKKGNKEGKATGREVVVVGAHYDTITHDHATMKITADMPAPGANDNGAAVITLLELARDLRDFKPSKALELVFFDFEEAFFLGSRAYAQVLKQRGGKAWLINLEMIGWSKPEPNRVKVYSRIKGTAGSEEDLLIAKSAEFFLKKEGLQAEILQNGFDRSDNWSFWQLGHPAITISQDWERNFDEKHYHTALDTADTVDWKQVLAIKQAVGEMVRGLVK